MTTPSCLLLPPVAHQAQPISRPSDRLELEADRVGAEVARGQAVHRFVPTGTSLASHHPGGRPLEPEIRDEMQAALGPDLGEVRVHTDAAADRAAAGLQATAWTAGSDVFFATGRYRPHSIAGRRLLAHELTHVAQHRANESADTIHRQHHPGEPDAEHDPPGPVVSSTIRLPAGLLSLRPFPLLDLPVPATGLQLHLGPLATEAAMRRVAAIAMHLGRTALAPGNTVRLLLRLPDVRLPVVVGFSSVVHPGDPMRWMKALTVEDLPPSAPVVPDTATAPDAPTNYGSDPTTGNATQANSSQIAGEETRTDSVTGSGALAGPHTPPLVSSTAFGIGPSDAATILGGFRFSGVPGSDVTIQEQHVFLGNRRLNVASLLSLTLPGDLSSVYPWNASLIIDGPLVVDPRRNPPPDGRYSVTSPMASGGVNLGVGAPGNVPGAAGGSVAPTVASVAAYLQLVPGRYRLGPAGDTTSLPATSVGVDAVGTVGEGPTSTGRTGHIASLVAELSANWISDYLGRTGARVQIGVVLRGGVQSDDVGPGGTAASVTGLGIISILLSAPPRPGTQQ